MTMNLNQSQFEQWIQEGKTFLADFWAPWCGYCRRIAPAYEALAQEYEGKLPITKVNTDEEQALAMSQGIQYLPTFILYKNGQRAATITAPKSLEDLQDFLESHLEP